MSRPTTPVAALQETLAAEHAALYVIGVLGGQAADSPATSLEAHLQDDYDAHRRRRDRLTALLVQRGAEPVAAAPSYRLPNAAATTGQLTVAARRVQQRCADVYGELVAATAGGERRFAMASLEEVALAALRYGAAPAPFPGLTAAP
ncbi:MAG: DUF4439 domain-containing protein [Marmoricola sp.]